MSRGFYITGIYRVHGQHVGTPKLYHHPYWGDKIYEVETEANEKAKELKAERTFCVISVNPVRENDDCLQHLRLSGEEEKQYEHI